MATINAGFYDLSADRTDPNSVFEYGYKYEDGTLVSATINEQNANKYIFDNFNAFDKNGNGVLTQTEVSKRLDELGIENTLTHTSADGWSENRKTVDKIVSNNYHEELYEKYMAPADLDKNGEVTAQELQKKYGFTPPPGANTDTNTPPAQQNPTSDNPSDNPGGQTTGLLTSSFEEIRKQMEQAAEKLKQQKFVDGVVNMFSNEKINTNGDWFIDKKEGLAAGYTQEEWANTYKNVDLDGNNKLSVGEWLSKANEGKDIDIQEFAKNYGESTANTLAKYDLNNDGKVTQDEIKSYDKQMDKLFHKTVTDTIFKTFSETSTNGDLFISENEALAAGSTKAEFADQLKLYDINGDNKISLGEAFYKLNNQQDINLQEFSNSYGIGAAQGLKRYDLNNDGKVTQDEIKAHDKEMDKSNNSITSKFKNLSTEAKVGIIITGVVVIVAIVALIVALAMKKDKKKEENKQLNFQQQIPTGQPGMMPQAYMMPMQPYIMPMQQMYYMPQSYMMPMQPQMPAGQPGMMPQANYGYNYQNVGYNVSNNLNSINQSQWRQM